MRLTTRTNLAMRTLMYCAVNTGRNIRTSEVARATNASENHLGQVINTLGQIVQAGAVAGNDAFVPSVAMGTSQFGVEKVASFGARGASVQTLVACHDRIA